MTKHFYVTTTIPYVNAPPHIGFALELVQADVIARYNRLLGNTVRLQTGTDENAFKNVLSAEARGIPVQQLVDENSERFRELAAALEVSVDHFQRTTDLTHRRAVDAFLARLQPGDVYTADYRGWYCTGCEDFYLETDAIDGRCPEHEIALVEVAEHNWFFRLSAYQKQLHDLVASRRIHVVPEAREREVLSFIARGLSDISISRDADRSRGWGIPYPGDPTQVVYVWIDALVNYLTGLGFPEPGDVERFWTDAGVCHVIGKNVWKFHAVYWPALLLSAGLPVPDQIVVHGFLTSEGKKISKSSGDAPDPIEYVDALGVDAVRYSLLRHARPFEDSDFSRARLEAAYDSDLAHGIGNLTSRLTALCESANVSGLNNEVVPPAPPGYHEALNSFRFDLALSTLWEEIAELNREIGALRPWEHLKHGRVAEARAALEPLVARLGSVSYWLSPFLPRAALQIRCALAATTIVRAVPLFPSRQKVVSEIPGEIQEFSDRRRSRSDAL
jgi:methionyl-tRNA synthetase